MQSPASRDRRSHLRVAEFARAATTGLNAAANSQAPVAESDALPPCIFESAGGGLSTKCEPCSRPWRKPSARWPPRMGRRAKRQGRAAKGPNSGERRAGAKVPGQPRLPPAHAHQHAPGRHPRAMGQSA
jgi:hypothetical protein